MASSTLYRTALASALCLGASCVPAPLYVAPAPVYAAVVPAIPRPRAMNIALRFTAQQGYRPLAVREAFLDRGGRVWNVLVELGPPTCGWNRVILNAFNGVVLATRPAVYACGYLAAPPPAPVYIVP